MNLCPVSFRQAVGYVNQHHRHHTPPRGHKFSIGAEVDGQLVGIVMVGRPVARMWDDAPTKAAHHYAQLAGTSSPNVHRAKAGHHPTGHCLLMEAPSTAYSAHSGKRHDSHVHCPRIARATGIETPRRPRHPRHRTATRHPRQRVRQKTAMSINFCVPGHPAPQGSKRHIGNGRMIESSRDLGPWRERVALAAHNAMNGRTLLAGPITLTLAFVLPRPKSAPKRSTPPAIKRPDIDKLARSCFDALSGVIYYDDAQVVDCHATKRLAELGETPGVTITLTTEATK